MTGKKRSRDDGSDIHLEGSFKFVASDPGHHIAKVVAAAGGAAMLLGHMEIGLGVVATMVVVMKFKA